MFVSLRDRVRHRFDVSVHEVEASDAPSRRVMAVTSAGSDARTLRATLDRVAALVNQSADALVVDSALDVFPWTATEPRYVPTDHEGEPR